MINRRRGGRRQQQEAAELNITAFMNLMVILVPFLLITAVFAAVLMPLAALGSRFGIWPFTVGLGLLAEVGAGLKAESV